MYCKHFALTAFPFDLTPEPDALFASSSLAEAEARLNLNRAVKLAKRGLNC